MPSRVIHIRLDDWVLLGCHDVLKAGGKDTTNLPISTIVRDTITAVIRKMQYDDMIPTYSKEDLADRVEEFYASDIELDEVFSPEELFELGTAPESEISDLAKEVARHIETEGEPTKVAVEKVKIGRKTKREKKVKTIDIFKQDSRPFKDFQVKAPKDRFVEQATTLDDKVFKKAVCICYSNLDSDLWGSMEAEQIIGDLIASHNAK